jgi:hypothetical protein
LHERDRVVADEQVGEGEVVPDLAGRFGEFHPAQVVAEGNALVERSEHTEVHLRPVFLAAGKTR